MKKTNKGFRFSPAVVEWLKQLAEQDGMTETGMLEWLVRREAKRRKMPTPKLEKGQE